MLATSAKSEANVGAAGGAVRTPAVGAALPAPARAVPSAEGWQATKSLIEALNNSKVYQEYAKAFTEATGLPLCLRPIESWQLPHHGSKRENGFCNLMAQKSRSCASCLQVQQKLSETATHEAQTVVCPTGLCDTAVPVRLGERLIGFLQTGQVFRRPPTDKLFERACRVIVDWGLPLNLAELKAAYFATPVIPHKQYEGTIKLLTLFSSHLSIITNQVVVQSTHAEPPIITKAKEFIRTHQSEDISLTDVARAVNTSTFYFCKIFKRMTGINFTKYLSRVRIERAKNLLLNPNLRVSEIAFEVGFQSLTHFNRVFKKIIGQSPTQYRSNLPGA